mmetsp:Transcript_101248/g.179879  ORF Transcript_101248/g.179879 Transcript_101248/m.179879 type:complete len:699 (+) Transcript_101248:35-2131(+)
MYQPTHGTPMQRLTHAPQGYTGQVTRAPVLGQQYVAQGAPLAPARPVQYFQQSQALRPAGAVPTTYTPGVSACMTPMPQVGAVMYPQGGLLPPGGARLEDATPISGTPISAMSAISVDLPAPPDGSIYGASLAGSDALPVPGLGRPFASTVSSYTPAPGSAASASAIAKVFQPPTAVDTARTNGQTSAAESQSGQVPVHVSVLATSAEAGTNPAEFQTRLAPNGACMLPVSTAAKKSTSAPDHLLDEVLAEHGYEITRDEGVLRQGLAAGALGKGAFGMVYKARNKQDRTCLAIKLAERASGLQKVINAEINILGMLDHPSIVRFFGAFAHAPSDWMVIAMEFVDGGDLLASLTQAPQIFDERLIRPMLFHVACGLAHAHEHGIMHRDLKPENVLLQRQNLFPKIADFGLARAMKQSEMAITIAGTPTYMAPEIQDPRMPYDFSADVYSLGLVLADMLDETHCCRWYVRASPGSNHDRHRKQWPAGAAAPKVSERLRELMSNMISQAPGARPTCHQICLDLKKLEEQQPLRHPLWKEQTRIGQPPPIKALSAQDAAEIAGRGGYGVGVRVLVKWQGQSLVGEVKHVSTSLCPGAVQVHFMLKGEEQALLICPWQFPEMLRPAPPGAKYQGSESASHQFPTMVFDADHRKPPLAGSAPPIAEEDSESTPKGPLLQRLERMAPVVKMKCQPSKMSKCRQQ